jgi:heme exporter protein D
VVWAVVAVVALPVIALGIRPVLEKMARRVKRGRVPVAE